MGQTGRLSAYRFRRRVRWALRSAPLFGVAVAAFLAGPPLTTTQVSWPEIRRQAETLTGASAGWLRSSTTRTIDGDTIDVAGERIRLHAVGGPIDAPELGKAQCPQEYARAQAARDRLRTIVGQGPMTIQRTGEDRYGRTIAIVRIGGRDVGQTLLNEGHVRYWPRLSRFDKPRWC